MSTRGARYTLTALLAGGVALPLVVPAVSAPPEVRPQVAAPQPSAPDGGPGADPTRARDLLAAAARAAHQRTWSGTQYVASAQGGAAWLAVVEVRHTPATGLQVTAAVPADADAGEAAVEVRTEVMDERLLGVLSASYHLRVGPATRCLGRPADVVEAWRPGATTPTGRFWLDRASGLILRREVYDPRGTLLRSAAYASFDLAAGSAPARPAPLPLAMSSDGLSGLAASVGVGAGRWAVPRTLPGHLRLFDVTVTQPDGVRVLHLAYTDGLSRLSLFAQPGRLGERAPDGFVHQPLAGADTWVLASSPERVVWNGGGNVWTLLSDAPTEVIRQVVGALPREQPPDRGAWARLVRGLSRVGSWLNPFA